MDRNEVGIYWRHIFYFTNKKSTVTFLTEVGLLLDLRTEIDCFDEKFYEEGRSEIPSQRKIIVNIYFPVPSYVVNLILVH